VRDRTHPLYDKRVEWPLEEWMVQSIMRYGVQSPVDVGRYPDFVDERGEPSPVVIDGRRRVLHAIEANRRLKEAGHPSILVPAILKKVDEKSAATLMVISNEHVVEDTPINKARKMQHLVQLGHDDAELCEAFRVDPATLRLWEKILELSSPVLDALDLNKMTAHAALELHGLPREEQKTILDAALKLTNGKPPTAADVRTLVKNKAKSPRKATRQKSAKAKLRSMRKEITPILSAGNPADVDDALLNSIDADVTSSPTRWEAFQAGIRWAAQVKSDS